MNIRNCSRCGKIYVYDGFSICINCRQEDEKDFQKVKEYLDENPGANIMVVSEATKVEARKIIEFLREGRLEISEENNILLTCERCGKSIKTGRFCERCALEMEKELRSAIKGNMPYSKNYKPRERIRITDRYKEK